MGRLRERLEKIHRDMKKRQRKIDKEILWPSLLEKDSLEKARVAFMFHVCIDPAWNDLTEDEMREELPWGD